MRVPQYSILKGRLNDRVDSINVHEFDTIEELLANDDKKDPAKVRQVLLREKGRSLLNFDVREPRGTFTADSRRTSIMNDDMALMMKGDNTHKSTVRAFDDSFQASGVFTKMKREADSKANKSFQARSKETVDDDPFYELYNCHKVTFLEHSLKNKLNHFKNVEFTRESYEERLVRQLAEKRQYEIKKTTKKNKESKFLKKMERLLQPKFLDNVERDFFVSYSRSGERIVSKAKEANTYENHYSAALVEPEYEQEDFNDFKTADELKLDLIGDLDAFEEYSNFDVLQLDFHEAHKNEERENYFLKTFSLSAKQLRTAGLMNSYNVDKEIHLGSVHARKYKRQLDEISFALELQSGRNGTTMGESSSGGASQEVKFGVGARQNSGNKAFLVDSRRGTPIYAMNPAASVEDFAGQSKHNPQGYNHGHFSGRGSEAQAATDTKIKKGKTIINSYFDELFQR